MKPPTLEMAKTQPKPKTPAEAKQEKAKEAYKARFNKTVASVEENLAIYNTSLTDGSFEDKEDEVEGEGEKRKKALQARITGLMNRAEKMKAVLDSGENIPEISEEIQVDYTYKNPQTGQIETKETITLNFEEKLQEFVDFYQKTNINLPSDFGETMREIWQRNAEDIQSTIEEKGFDDILIVPSNIPLPELAEKMKMENGYYFYQVKEDFSDVVSQNVDTPRLVLYHKATLSKIQKKNGLDVHLNITAGDAEKLFKQNPDQYLSTLEDHIILERKNFDETGEHLSDYTKQSAVWLPGTKCGSRFVYSYWDPEDGELCVDARGADFSYSGLGCRPSRYFV